MTVVIINRDLGPEERQLVDNMLEEGAHIYRKGEYEVAEEKKKLINYQTMEQVLAFGDKEVDGEAVADSLKFDESSLWYYHKFRAYFRLRNLKYEAAAIKELADNHDKVYYYSADILIEGFEFPDNVKVYGSLSKKNKKNYFSLLAYFIILMSRWIINVFTCSSTLKSENILMDVTKRQAFLDMDSLKVNKGNYVSGYLMEKVGKDFLIIDEAVQPKVTDGAIISLSRDHLFGKGKLKNRYFGEPILLNYFLSLAQRKRKNDLTRNIDHKLLDIKKVCAGEDKLLVNIFLSFRGATNFYIIKYLAYKKFFKKHKFKTISTVDENSPALRAILDAARSEGIQTIGLQHGSIHDLHPAYVYTSSDIKRNALPGHTLVWGEFWKQFLIEKGHYKAEQLLVCGQIRTDIIPLLQNHKISRNTVIPEMANDDRLIVFASQPQRDPRLRERAALDIMQAAHAIPDAFLVIKLHPNERKDTGYYKELAKRAGLEKIYITLEVDLYLLISVCDVLVTCFSTVGTETIYFRKPLVILDHLRQDIQNYHKEGVALQASNIEELQQHLEDFLNGQKKIDEKAYERFISKYAFAIDGKASERALEFIKRLGD